MTRNYFSEYFKNLPLGFAGANFFLAIILCSCNKTSQIGLDVQPDNTLLNVSVVDTITLLTKTVETGSVLSDETASQGVTNDVLIGTYIDPVFGTTSASLYTQLRLNTAAPNFGTTPIIDSVVLSLVYSSPYYGKSTFAQQTINVYEVTETMNINNSYYSDDTLTTSTTDLAGAFTFTPSPTASSQLKVLLDNAIGQQILDAQGSANLADNGAFQNYVKGLFITSQNTAGLNVGDGNLLRFNMDDAYTVLTLHYHNTLEATSFSFSFNSVSRFTHFKHDYSTAIADLSTQLSSTPPSQNSVVYLQPLSGTKVKIEIPYIKNLISGGNVGINKAELIIKREPSASYQSDVFAIPDSLGLVAINGDGSTYQLPDYYEADNYFGGRYDGASGQYVFNIARYIQQVLDGKIENKGLYLVPLNEASTPNRLVIGGGDSGNSYQMQLIITETKLP